MNSMRMARVIDRGLAAEGRLVKFMATVPDVPGAIARLLVKVGETGADVRSMVPERTWMKRDIFSISVSKQGLDVNSAGDRTHGNHTMSTYDHQQKYGRTFSHLHLSTFDSTAAIRTTVSMNCAFLF